MTTTRNHLLDLANKSQDKHSNKTGLPPVGRTDVPVGNSAATTVPLDEHVLDDVLIKVLDDYLVRRSHGPVDHDWFIQRHSDLHPKLNLAGQLPGLLGSIDALHGFAPSETATQTSQNWDSIVPRQLGDFEVLEEIGRGGMGIVYRARHVSLDRIVALKVLPLSVVLDQEQITRFRLEAQAAAQLNHPHIVPIYWVGCESGVHCYSMPLIDGRTLSDLIAERTSDVNDGPVDAIAIPEKSSISHTESNVKREIDLAIRWMQQAADALSHAHAHGVIHRDVKPSNLMIDRQNNLWITDFGLARWRDGGTLTRSGTVVGTACYMSPEQASGDPALVDHRSDIYCLGVTFYELLTGHKVYQETADKNLPMPRPSIEPTRLRSLNKSIRKDLETIVMKSLAIAPGDRYATASDLAADLQRFIDGKPILASPPGTIDQFAKWSYRHRKLVSLATLFCIVALIGSFVTLTKFAHQTSLLGIALENADTNLTIADKNLELAKANFRITREVLDRFGLRAAEQLSGIAGAESLREELVQDLLLYYENFAARAQTEASLQNDLAYTHYRAAKIIEEIGATERALVAYRRAIELYQQLDPSSDNKFQVGLCRNSIALLSAELGDESFADNSFRLAISELTPLISDNHERQRTLATVHGNYGLLLASSDRPDQAREQFRRAIDLLPDTEHRDAESCLTAAMIWNNLGYLSQSVDISEAIEFNDRAITTLREGSTKHRRAFPNAPNHPEIKRSLAMSLNNQASLFSRANEQVDAMRCFVESIQHYRDLVDRMPTSARYTEELAITYNNYGRALHRTGNEAGAKLALNRSRDLMEVLIKRRPSETKYHRALDGVRKNLAQIDPSSVANSAFGGSTL